MRVKIETLFGRGMLFLMCILAWSIWATAQAATNQILTSVRTNQPSGLVRDVEHFDQRYLTFWLDRVEFLRERTFLGERLWKYPASLIYVLLAFYLSKLIDLATCVWFKKLAAKTETKLDDFLLEIIHGPIKVVVFAIFLIIGLNMFDWPVKVRLYFFKGLILIVAASLTYLALKFVDVL